MDLRKARDDVENSVADLTARIDAMAERSGLTAAIEGGWQPDWCDDDGLPVAGAGGEDGRRALALAREMEDLIEAAQAGVAAARLLWAQLSGDLGKIPNAPALLFCIHGVDTELERMGEIVADALEEARREGSDPCTTTP